MRVDTDLLRQDNTFHYVDDAIATSKVSSDHFNSIDRHYTTFDGYSQFLTIQGSDFLTIRQLARQYVASYHMVSKDRSQFLFVFRLQ